MIYDVYAGSYTGPGGGAGLYHIKLDTKTLQMNLVKAYSAESDNPSFLAVKREHVYAVTERSDYGCISAFKRDPFTGCLEFQNQLRIAGTAMCHLTAWPDGKHLSAANYRSGSLVTCSLKEDGSIDTLCDKVQHEGVGFDSQDRQSMPHVHSTVVSPDGKYLYAADLGLDWVACYEILEGGKLRLSEEERQIKAIDGSGPRHFVFSDDGRFLYLVTEMGNHLLVYEGDDGKYKCVQQLSLLPPDFDGFDYGADIHFSGDKKFLYASCRGRDCITVFRMDRKTGLAEPTGFYDTYGHWPRNFCITPDDSCLLIANQKEGNLVLCPRDPETGAVKAPAAELKFPQLAFVTAIEREENAK